MNLDKKDLQLIYELNLNCRQSLPQLARKLKLSKQVVDYRLKRLITNNVIEYFPTIISFTKLGYTQYKVYLKFQNLSITTEQEYISYLKKQKNIVWIAECRGNYDLAITIIAKDVEEFGRILNKITKDYSRYILQKNILLVQYSSIYTKNYLINSKDKKEINYAVSPEKKDLNEKEKLILSIISTHARSPIIELMKNTKLTREVLTYQLKKLKTAGIILQYSCKANLNYKLYKLILATKNLGLEEEKKIKTYCQYHHNCVQFLKLIGSEDLELEFEVKDEETIHKILLDLRNKFSDIIRNYNLLLIGKQHKYEFYPL